MLTLKSEKTSLLDLSIEEIRNVAWEAIDAREFVEDLNNINFLSRLAYADRKVLAHFYDWGNFIEYMEEDALEMVIAAKQASVRRITHTMDSDVWDNDRQFSLDFLNKHSKCLNLNRAYKQKCITPEFLEEHSKELHVESFLNYFERLHEPEVFKLFNTYKDGMFSRYVTNSKIVQFFTQDALVELGMDVPYYYNTVITEQRIMSGHPCDDGQRSFTIWLRKFRRVTGRSNDYPTWNEMLELLKSHPRLNSNGYVEWIYTRCLKHNEQTVSEYPEHLSYQAKRVERESYQYITGVDAEQAIEDFNIEFSDVINPTPETTNNTTTDYDESADYEIDDVTYTDEVETPSNIVGTIIMDQAVIVAPFIPNIDSMSEADVEIDMPSYNETSST